MKIENISEKVIGLGNVTVLPGETQTVPVAYETSPILEVYEKCGFAKFSGKPSAKKGKAAKDEDDGSDEALAELRKAQLKALPKMTDEEAGKLAKELGIKPSDCKDAEDVKKKIEAALK